MCVYMLGCICECVDVSACGYAYVSMCVMDVYPEDFPPMLPSHLHKIRAPCFSSELRLASTPPTPIILQHRAGKQQKCLISNSLSCVLHSAQTLCSALFLFSECVSFLSSPFSTFPDVWQDLQHSLQDDVPEQAASCTFLHRLSCLPFVYALGLTGCLPCAKYGLSLVLPSKYMWRE